MNQPFDRGAEDLGNSIHFEHVNIQVPDQRLTAKRQDHAARVPVSPAIFLT
jgi:hypothetical protein